MLYSSRTRFSKKPRSEQLIVICLINSLKIYLKSSSRTWQTPCSRAYCLWSAFSNCSCRLMTSTWVAGCGETYLIQRAPFSMYSSGGRIELR